MKVLGLDTALQTCSAAILVDGVETSRRVAPMEKGHAEHLAPLIAETLSAAGLAFSDIDRVGVVVGPGGFTGVRVGLAFARGLALGTGIAVIGVQSLSVLAAQARMTISETPVAAVIDARRGELYAALYGAEGNLKIPPFVSSPPIVRERLQDAVGDGAVAAIGTGVDKLEIASSDWTPIRGDGQIDPAMVAHLAAQARPPFPAPAPLYIRPPDAKPPQRSRFDGLHGE